MKRYWVAAVVAATLLGACSEGGDDDSSPSNESTSTSASPQGSTSPGEIDQVALDFLGSSGGVASGEPLVVGWVNQEGGTPSFPEATIGADVAVDYINSVLGGVGGRPLELRKCFVQAEEDGARCAQEMLADPEIQVVLTGTMVVGNAPLLSTLQGQKPVVIGSPSTTPEFLATDAYAFTPGSPGVVQGMAIFIGKYLPEGVPDNVAVVYSDSAAGQAAVDGLFKPVLDGYGIETTAVPVPDTAGPQEFAAAIQASGAADADVFVLLVPLQGCIGAYDALGTLGITTPVVTTALCQGTPMAEHLSQIGESGDAPDGWYYGGGALSYFIPHPQIDNYLATIERYADEHDITGIEYTGFAGVSYGQFLDLTSILNEVGTDSLSSEAIRGAIRAWDGPAWALTGPIGCGQHPIFPSLCGFEVGVQQYKDGEWLSVRDAYSDNAINPAEELTG